MSYNQIIENIGNADLTKGRGHNEPERRVETGR
jgi:hypothetical protein